MPNISESETTEMYCTYNACILSKQRMRWHPWQLTQALPYARAPAMSTQPAPATCPNAGPTHRPAAHPPRGARCLWLHMQVLDCILRLRTALPSSPVPWRNSLTHSVLHVREGRNKCLDDLQLHSNTPVHYPDLKGIRYVTNCQRQYSEQRVNW